MRADALVERDAEVSALRATVMRATEGIGGSVVVVGQPGIGKTALLQTVPEATLRARGGELEQEFPYGVIRQLFERTVRRLDAATRATVLDGPARPLAGLLLGQADVRAAPGDSFALEHAVYWLTTYLAERGPQVIVVDDAHWADLASLRALLYLVRRVAELPVAVVLATRTVNDARRPVIDRLIAEATVVLEPAPLTSAGVGSLVHRTLQAAERAFCDACHSASGGNPFLVTELIGAIRTLDIDPSGSNAGRIRSVGAQTLRRSVLLRLGALSPGASAVARTLAVIGEDHPIDLVSELADVSVRVATSAIDELRVAHIVEAGSPARFVHSIVRDAVHDDISAAERSRLHRAVAVALAAVGAAPDAVAGHLLLTTPGTDPWTFGQLVGAASGSAASAAPEAAASYLDRALRETVPAVDRAPLLLALGAARYQIAGADAIGPLTQARDAATDRRTRLQATQALASAYMSQLRVADSWSTIEDAIVDFADAPDLARELEIYSAQALFTDIDADSSDVLLRRTRSWRPDPTGAGSRDRSMLAMQAWVSACSAAPATETATLARAALSSGSLVHDDVYYVSFDAAAWALIAAGCYDEAATHLTSAIDSCVAAGRLLRAATLLPVRAELRRRLGLLALGLEDARFAVDVLPAEQIYAPQAASAYVLALVEAADLAAARRVLVDLGFDRTIPSGGIADVLWFARGRLRIAEGDLDGGVDDLLRYGAVCDRLGRRNPGLYPWRSTAVAPLVQLGRRDEATELAQEETAFAERTGVAEQRGRAFLALGLARGDVEPLNAAAGILDASTFVLDAALARLTLGRELRRNGKRDRAREHLRTAADAATRIGAIAIADAARAELIASGSRPRRTARTGVDALTPSELRVASLAARGLTNREIAHTLYVSPKTIETHLAGVYRKLGIARKTELAEALGAG